jgi:hypothetical protein
VTCGRCPGRGDVPVWLQPGRGFLWLNPDLTLRFYPLFLDLARPEFPADDLDYCTDVDRFDFTMLAERRDGLLIMTTVQ